MKGRLKICLGWLATGKGAAFATGKGAAMPPLVF